MSIFVSVIDAANELGVGMTKLYRLLDSGKLPAVKLERSTVIYRAALDAYIGSLLPYTPGRRVAVRKAKPARRKGKAKDAT